MKTKTKRLRAITLFMCYFCYAEGVYIIPIAYTLPSGLQSVNGSSSTGGCEEHCLEMPYTGTAINGCDCPGNTVSVSSVLIDGVIPSIDTTPHGTWASELFVVNRSGEGSILIGFDFSSDFYLRGIEITLFYCLVQDIGISGVTVYSSFLFPTFSSHASTHLVTHSSPPPTDNCQSLSTISVPVQPMESSNIYFVEFLFTNGSIIHQFNCLYLGEIRFSDVTPTMAPTLEMSNENKAIATTTLSEQNPTITAIGYSPTTSSLSMESNIPTKNFNDSITQEGSNSTTITVAALAGIIGLLILLMMGGCLLFLCFACYRKHKLSLLNVPHNQYALPTELTLQEKRSSLPISANSCYTSGKCSPRMTYELPDPSSVYCYPEIYSELDGDSGLYDDIGENHYADIPETIIANKTNNDSGKSIDVNSTAANKDKKYAPIESETLRQPIDKTTNETAPGAVGIYRQVVDNIEEVQASEYYTDILGSRAASQLSICSRRSSCNSGPLLQLSRPLCHTMEDNPTYNSAWSLLEDNEKQEPEEDTYADPDARFSRPQLTIYETVYSDSLIKPSIFKQNSTATLNNSGMVKQDSTKESDEKEEEKNLATLMYSPIYLSYDALSPATHQKQPIVVTNDNIRGIKVLGTGFFGKVVLANTVGLSLKDLGLSETDDDKSASIRVAVKKLKLNASKSTRDAFEKECRFMSRLDHPNVIRMLGVCTTDPSQFIIMEYMEKGDLNGYLEEYKSIINKPKSPKEGEIHVSTLVHMCTQIAAAMKYLVSCNFIHRDLAARNCLVGDKDVIKLADFGMSRNLYESHYYMVQGNAVMPVRWMASECFYGKFSAKTDVWAFGVTMWEIFMLAKERPYSDMEDMELVNDAIEKEERSLLQQPDDCPDDVFEVMMRCWARNPKDRATFDELHALLIQLS